MTEREFAVDVVRRLRAAGFEALWAGGCVRDELLGLTPKDYDVATSATPEQVKRVFRRTIAVGESFGVIEVLGPRPLRVQVATFRSDVSYSDGRRPDAVVFSTAREDALRRDFTVNGMFFDPLDGKLIDYVGGQDDLRAHVLRAIGDPGQRFREDKLRILRAVRLASRFEFTIDPATADAARAMAPQIGAVAAERVADELRKLLVDRHRARGMRLFLELGLGPPLLPELVPMEGLPQGLPRPNAHALPPPGLPGSHDREPAADLWEHTLRVLDLLGETPTFPLALAALLHDVGKPRTVGRTPDRYTFYGHEQVGKRLAAEIGLRLRLSNDERERAEWLVEKHQVLADVHRMRVSKLKVLFMHPGIEELFELHRADALASGREPEHVNRAIALRCEWEAAGVLNPPPVITGEDLLAWSLKQGPLFKRLLDAVREAQLEGSVQTKEQAKALIEQLLAETGTA
jgi:poly(A) polymerase